MKLFVWSSIRPPVRTLWLVQASSLDSKDLRLWNRNLHYPNPPAICKCLCVFQQTLSGDGWRALWSDHCWNVHHRVAIDWKLSLSSFFNSIAVWQCQKFVAGFKEQEKSQNIHPSALMPSEVAAELQAPLLSQFSSWGVKFWVSIGLD